MAIPQEELIKQEIERLSKELQSDEQYNELTAELNEYEQLASETHNKINELPLMIQINDLYRQLEALPPEEETGTEIEYRSDDKNIIERIENATTLNELDVPMYGLTVHEYMLLYEKMKELDPEHSEFYDSKLSDLTDIRPEDIHRLNYIINPYGNPL